MSMKDLEEVLDCIENLQWEKREKDYLLKNLKEVNGMDLAEALTYLQDEGYPYIGPMLAESENGLLVVFQK